MSTGRPRHVGLSTGRRPRGLTLIEIAVVLTIVAALMGATVYSIQMVTNSDLRNESMRLTSTIKYTWSRAALNNAQYRMVIDLDNDTYHTEVTKAPLVAKEEDEEDDSDSQYLSEEARQLGEQREDESSFEGED